MRDRIITDTDDSSSESAMLDGSGSSDPDGTIVSYSWQENGMEIAAGINPTVELALGTHVITLVVADDDGLTASDDVVIVVNAPFISSDPVVLYTFDEGSGSTVTDTSGVGSALDLTIADPANVTWGSGTLTIDSATIIDSGVAATKVTNAVIASGEITVGAWVKSANTTQDGPARIVTISQDAYYI